ncbi:hypothetical protein M2403_004011 [Rahnella sp. BIGb0603]|jgi:hypothetical protein|uniref:hypothetical protein n=1 Tax=Rahnella TaxID=34037 RepID=UPI00216711C8|nr:MULTISPECIES: hypothetical protein [Rahnella]MCS3425381.1 hypothetical protein [Rahnella sp. BIGb0603]MDF1897159.1 hypothetical protein [Rahnella contaminans]
MDFIQGAPSKWVITVLKNMSKLVPLPMKVMITGLMKVKPKSEYENVLQDCSLNLGEKKYSDWKIKHKQLAIRIYFGDTSTIDLGKVTMISDGFGEAFEALHPSLSDLPMTGFPFVAMTL